MSWGWCCTADEIRVAFLASGRLAALPFRVVRGHSMTPLLAEHSQYSRDSVVVPRSGQGGAVIRENRGRTCSSAAISSTKKAMVRPRRSCGLRFRAKKAWNRL